jgi:metal-responsive CopG/Arc/MetJ family transcriptional regulator
MQGRRHVSVRLTWDGVRALDELAARWGVDRSTVIRRLLAEGAQRYLNTWSVFEVCTRCGRGEWHSEPVNDLLGGAR